MPESIPLPQLDPPQREKAFSGGCLISTGTPACCRSAAFSRASYFSHRRCESFAMLVLFLTLSATLLLAADPSTFSRFSKSPARGASTFRS